MKLVALVGDGHTRYDSENGSYGFDRLLPFVTYPFTDGLFVVAATEMNRNLVGLRIVRYGDVPADEAMARVGNVVSADNPMGVMRGIPYAMQRIAILDGVAVTNGLDVVTIVVEGVGGVRESVTVGTIPYHDPSFVRDELVFMNDGSDPPRYLVRAPTRFHWLKHPLPPAFWSEPIPELNAMYVQLNRIRDGAEQSFAAFWATTFADMDARNVTRLILDLRRNPGGNNTLLQPLIHGIIRSAPLNTRGNTFVIVGRDTFSAAVNLATRLERETNAMFVGEPVAAAPNHFGDSEVFYHYQTDLTMIVSEYRWQDSVPWDTRESVDVDLLAPISSSDFQAGSDPAMRAIREFLGDRR